MTPHFKFPRQCGRAEERRRDRAPPRARSRGPPVIYPTVRDDFGLISMIEMDFAPVRMTGRMSGKSEMPHFRNEKRPDQGKLLTLAV